MRGPKSESPALAQRRMLPVALCFGMATSWPLQHGLLIWVREGCLKVEKATVQEYRAFLKDKTRPPSKGGNTRAWHQHTLMIADERYSFLALGAKKWVYASDTVTFEWEWDGSRKYRNIVPESVRTFDKDGNPVERGHHGSKPWRTADVRFPVSRREWRD